jgi:hypothetical protein
MLHWSSVSSSWSLRLSLDTADTDSGRSKEEESAMFQPIGLLWGIVTLIFGILVIVYPKFLRYTVGIYLVIVGLWAIIPRLHF